MVRTTVKLAALSLIGALGFLAGQPAGATPQSAMSCFDSAGCDSLGLCLPIGNGGRKYIGTPRGYCLPATPETAECYYWYDGECGAVQYWSQITPDWQCAGILLFGPVPVKGSTLPEPMYPCDLSRQPDA
jgi:hypothetical protein